jgi:hypothetical protein
MLIEPSDPESWVRTPIAALDGRTFLEVANGTNGEDAVAAYFGRIEAFEQPYREPNSDWQGLGHTLRFDSADLDSNRADLVSPSQRSRLLRRDMLQLVAASACLIGGVLFNVGLIAGWFTARGKGAGLGLALMALGVVVGFASALLWLDLATGKVAMIEGQLQMIERSTRSGVVCSFQVGGLTFNVPSRAYDQIPAVPMREYYLRRSHALLALEPAK